MTITFVDAGVLIQAARGEPDSAARAIVILDDPARELASSVFVRLEVLPKAVYYRNTAEVKFYELFFNSVKHWAQISETLIEDAYREASRTGLAAVDALHVAAAASVKADEFVTTEKPAKLLHRTTMIKVVSV
ncbi:MAG: type II toxin-antitoxin system VapC family toxin [Chloroflexota bacterium]